MKVTISFNGTKIVVPCGDGEISVREVTTLAATRYKKAIGKTNAYWVSVASLKSHEGGILDQDDLIGDVCDDREQLAAIFNEQNGGHYHGSGGDGMSSASDSDTKENNFVGGGGMMLQGVALSSCSSSSTDNLLQVMFLKAAMLYHVKASAIVLASSSFSSRARKTGISWFQVSISDLQSILFSVSHIFGIFITLENDETIFIGGIFSNSAISNKFLYYEQCEEDTWSCLWATFFTAWNEKLES